MRKIVGFVIVVFLTFVFSCTNEKEVEAKKIYDKAVSFADNYQFQRDEHLLD